MIDFLSKMNYFLAVGSGSLDKETVMQAHEKALDELEKLTLSKRFAAVKHPGCPYCQKDTFHMSRAHALAASAVIISLCTLAGFWLSSQARSGFFDFIGSMLMLGLLGVMLAGSYTRVIDEWLAFKHHKRLLNELDYIDRLWLALRYEMRRVREQYAGEQDPAALCLHEVDRFLQQAQNLQYHLRTTSVSRGPAEGLMECLSAISHVRRQKQILQDYRADCLSLLQDLYTITDSMQQHQALQVAMFRDTTGQPIHSPDDLVVLCLERIVSPMRMAEIYLVLTDMDAKVARACRADQLKQARKKSFKEGRPNTELMKTALQKTIYHLSPVQDFVKRL